MLLPSQINPNLSPLSIVVELHHQFDEAIEAAARIGRWPAVVRNYRDGVSAAELESVVSEYRAAGWIVDVGQASGVRTTIDHPDREGRR